MFFSHRPSNMFGMPYGYHEVPASWYRPRYEPQPFQFHPAYSRSMYHDNPYQHQREHQHQHQHQHQHEYSHYPQHIHINNNMNDENDEKQQGNESQGVHTWNELHQHLHPRHIHMHMNDMNMNDEDEEKQEEIPRIIPRHTWNMNELHQHLHPHSLPRPQQKRMYEEYQKMEPDEDEQYYHHPRMYLRDAWGYREPVPHRRRTRSMSRDRVPPPPPPPPRRVYGDDMHDFPAMLQKWDQPETKNERHIPIRVVPTFTMTTLPDEGEYDIPTRIMPSRSRLLTFPSRSRSSSSQTEDNTDHSSYPPEFSSILQSNPDAIRPLLLRLLPLYEPYLRDALKQDKELNGEKKGKNNNTTTTTNNNNNNNNNSAQSKQEKKQNPNFNDIYFSDNVDRDEKKQEPVIQKMTPMMTRVITPLQETKTPLEESKAYDIPPPSPEEASIEPRPAPARKQQIYAYKSCKTPKSSANTNTATTDKKDKGNNNNSSNNNKSTTAKATTTSTDTSSSQPAKSSSTSSKTAASTSTSTSTSSSTSSASTSRNIPIRDVTASTAKTSTKPSTAATECNKTSDNTKTESYRPINIPIRESRQSETAKVTSNTTNNNTTTTNNNNNVNNTKNNTNTADVMQEAEAPLRSTSVPITTARRSPNIEIEDIPPTPMHRSRTPAAEDAVMAPKPTSTTSSDPNTAPDRISTPSVDTIEAKSTQPEQKEQQQQQQQQQEQKQEKQSQSDENSSQPIPMDVTRGDDTYTSNNPDEKSEDLNASGSSSQVSVDSATIKEVEASTQDHSHDHDHDVDHSNQHSPTSSTYSSIMHSPTESPSISTPASPDAHLQHTRNDSANSDHEWQFTSPMTQSPATQTTTLSQSQGTGTVRMNKSMDQDGYIVTITLPEHITKHDIRLDHDDQTLSVHSIDDPPMFPVESITLSTDADMEHLSAKSHLIGDFHTILVKIPKRIINSNKRAIRIE